MDLSEIQAAYYMVAATGVIIAAIYYVMNMKSSNKTRQAQLYMQVYNPMLSREMYRADLDNMKTEMRSFEDFLNVMKDKELYSSFMMWGGYFEGMGVMVREGLLDIRLVVSLNSGPVIWFWERYREMILNTRVKTGHKRSFVELEYLYDQVVEYSKRHPELEITSAGIELPQ